MYFCMGFGLKDFYGGSAAAAVVDNPIYVAILVVLIIMIVVYFTLVWDMDDEHFWSHMVRTTIYSTIPTLGIMYMYSQAQETQYVKRYGDSARTELIERTKTGTGDIKAFSDDTGKSVSMGQLHPKVDQLIGVSGGAEPAADLPPGEIGGLKPTCFIYGKIPSSAPVMN